MPYSLPKAETCHLFDQLATSYDDPALRFGAFTADRLLAGLKPQQNHKILDLACGTGHVALSACQTLHTGRITAIDLSERMIDKADEKIKHLGIKNIDLYDMDAENLAFKSDFFDHVVCAYGLPFFNDPIKALKDCQRVTHKGGKIVFAVWGKSAFNPLLPLLKTQLKAQKLDTFIQAADVGMDAQQLQTLFKQAGLNNAHIQTHQMGYRLQRKADSWDVIYNSHLRIALSALSPQNQTQFKLAFIDSSETYQNEAGLWLDMETHFISAMNGGV